MGREEELDDGKETGMDAERPCRTRRGIGEEVPAAVGEQTELQGRDAI